MKAPRQSFRTSQGLTMLAIRISFSTTTSSSLPRPAILHGFTPRATGFELVDEARCGLDGPASASGGSTSSHSSSSGFDRKIACCGKRAREGDTAGIAVEQEMHGSLDQSQFNLTPHL